MTWPLTGPLYGSVWPTCGPQATIWFNRTLKLMNETQRGWGERAADWSQPTVSFHNSQHAPLPSSLLRAAPATTLLPLWWRHVRLGPWKDHWPGLYSRKENLGTSLEISFLFCLGSWKDHVSWDCRPRVLTVTWLSLWLWQTDWDTGVLCLWLSLITSFLNEVLVRPNA